MSEPVRENARLAKEYDRILRTLVGMIVHADKWVFPQPPVTRAKSKAN
jgi:hypothetical protein